LLDQWLSTIPQHSWVSKLFGYQFSVEFKPSHQNGAVDALSRRDKEYVAINALSLSQNLIYLSNSTNQFAKDRRSTK
jgi:hypothetical protein